MTFTEVEALAAPERTSRPQGAPERSIRPQGQSERTSRAQGNAAVSADNRLQQQGEEALSDADNTMAEAEELKNIIDAREKLR